MNRQRLWAFVVAAVVSSGCLSAVGSSGGDDALRDLDANDEVDAAAPPKDAGEVSDAGTSSPDAGGARDARVDEPTESFKALYADILAPKCATSYCHVATNRGGLNMTSASEAYKRLVGKKAGDLERDPYSLCKETGLTRVVPFDPDASLLMQKLTPSASGVVCGKAMPLDKPALPEPEIARIARWISQGAANN